MRERKKSGLRNKTKQNKYQMSVTRDGGCQVKEEDFPRNEITKENTMNWNKNKITK